MKEWAEQFYKSKAWMKCRASFIVSKFNICERCHGVGKIVHHKIILTPKNINDTNITLNWNNLELLCQDCHNKEHMSEGITVKGCIFNENGDLINNISPPG